MSALDLARRRAAEALANRARMPIVSGFVDELRQSFPEARVRYAEEAGQTVGKPGDQGVVPVVGSAVKAKQRRAA